MVQWEEAGRPETVPAFGCKEEAKRLSITERAAFMALKLLQLEAA